MWDPLALPILHMRKCNFGSLRGSSVKNKSIFASGPLKDHMRKMWPVNLLLENNFCKRNQLRSACNLYRYTLVLKNHFCSSAILYLIGKSTCNKLILRICKSIG